MNAAIRAESVSKIYKIYFGPRALLKELVLGRRSHHAVQALNGLTFGVAKGECFGVVGDNGAGKSTLLKILTGTAFPTSGSVQVTGNVSALLELGAGFHPEFTGRENIRFNGTLMGLSPETIQSREEEIIRFSGLGEAIDHPVKTYSSGMYVRLGFAVATGFDPDILIIDEALSVGDQYFQKKSTDRIIDFKKRGKTILFCSHNLYQVRALCDQTMWLERGSTKLIGDSADVVDAYTSTMREGANKPKELFDQGGEKQLCWIESARLRTADSSRPLRVRPGDSLTLDVYAHFEPAFQGTPGIAVGVVRNDGVVVYLVANTMESVPLKKVDQNRYFIRLILPNLALMAGHYYFNVGATDEENLQGYDILERVEPFVVSSAGLDYGVVKLEHRWENT